MAYKPKTSPFKTATIITLAAIALITGLFILKRIYTYEGTHREHLFDNEQVKSWKTVITPTAPLNMHRHEMPRIIIPLKGGKLQRIESTGETRELDYQTGKVYWEDADPLDTLHAVLNTGKENMEVIVIEFQEGSLANYKP